jgi:hypothetical protein
MRVLRLLGVGTAIAAAAFGAGAEHAGAELLTCNASDERPFAAWGDYSRYALAPNGSLESGSTGWTLAGGAKVVGTNNLFRGGNGSLVLPAGSSATSPAACVKLADPASRFFVRSLGSGDGRLRVEAVHRSLFFTMSTTLGYVQAGGGWQPSPKYAHELPTVLAQLSLDGSASLRFRFTPVGDAAFGIDDLFVDPLVTY